MQPTGENEVTAASLVGTRVFPRQLHSTFLSRDWLTNPNMAAIIVVIATQRLNIVRVPTQLGHTLQLASDTFTAIALVMVLHGPCSMHGDRVGWVGGWELNC